MYQEEKVSHSIFRAQQNINQENKAQAEEIGKLVVKDLRVRFEKEKILGSDEIGDVVERILIDEKLYDIARAFIIARERQRQEAKAEQGLGVVDDIGLPYNSIVVIRNKYLKKTNRAGRAKHPNKCFTGWRELWQKRKQIRRKESGG